MRRGMFHENIVSAWSYADMIEAIRILTIYMSDELVDYEDFVSWHSTCKIAWQPLASDYFGSYTSRFVESAEVRNKALYLKIPHANTFHHIRVLGAIKQVCYLVEEIVMVLRTISTYNVTQFRIKPTLQEMRWHYDKAVPFLSPSQIEVINRTARHIKNRYGWDTSFVSTNSPTQKLKAPLKHTVTLGTKSFALYVETSNTLFMPRPIIL